jgi:hypothetical protein
MTHPLAPRLRCATCYRQAVFTGAGLKCPDHPRSALVWLPEGEEVPEVWEQEELFG